MNQGFIGWSTPQPAAMLAFRLRLAEARASVTIPVPSDGSIARLLVSGRTDAAAVSEIGVNLTVNADAGANYNWTRISNSNTTLSGADGVGQTQIALFNAMSGATSAAGVSSGFEAILFDYEGPFHKSVFVHNSHSITTTGAGNRRITITSGFWLSTNPITSITITPASGSFVPGTLFRLMIEP